MSGTLFSAGKDEITLPYVSSEIYLEWYRCMSLIRKFEQTVEELNKAGLVPGTAHLYVGMEAIAVGSCAAMAHNDFLTSTHRGHGHCIARKLDLGRMLAEILGRADGYCRGKGGSMHIADISRGVLGADGIVGGGIPIAVGAALGMRMRGNNSVVFCFFGDGASNQGSFHESINLAAVLQLPVVFICENNLWALSAPFAETTAGGNVSKRAVSYGISGERVDGNDIEAVFKVVSECATRARNGAGPSLVECVSYRWEPHSLFTRGELRPHAEIEEWKRKDPIERLRKQLIKRNISTHKMMEQIDAEISAELLKAVDFAKGSPTPEPESAFEDLEVRGAA
jgi:TPP-dependent pyruvate/acetoin dehydrogenase alpha subunit